MYTPLFTSGRGQLDLTCFCLQTTHPLPSLLSTQDQPKQQLFGLWILLHHNVYVIVKSPLWWQVQENFKVGTDPDNF